MLLDGKALSNKMKQELKDQISTLVEKYGNAPTLSIVVVGSNPASEIYVRNKVKSATNIGMKASVTKLDENVTMEELIKVVDDLNNDSNVLKEESSDKYIFTSQVNYPNNSSLKKQKVTVTNDLMIEKVEILN